MDNLIKKPYEISLWEDRLVWHRKKLIEVTTVNEETYEPGKYYSQNQKAIGTSLTPYSLDYDGFKDERKYFSLNEEDEGIKRFDADSIIITPESNSDWYDKNGNIVPNVVFQYFNERKIATIGSNTMDTPVRAISSKLTSNINGSNTLTFQMYSRYYDEETKQFYSNPFLKLLSNERKVKLRHGVIGASDTKWYDFVVKNIQENSDTKTFTYTCKDLFINELSKSGFGLVLDAKLENSIGNIEKLAGYILEESDWRLGEGSSKLIQTIEEPVYMIQLNKTITAKNMQDETDDITINKGEYIYGLYTPINNKEPYFQFLYVPKIGEDVSKEPYEIDDNHVITNSKNWYLDGMTYNEDKSPTIAQSMILSKEYRGARLIRQAKIEYDATIDKYVYVYKDAQDNTYYGYTESDYISPTSVSNYITSPNSFTSTAGWEVGGVKVEGKEDTQFPSLIPQGYPDMRDINYEDLETTTFQSFLKYKVNYNGQLLFNSGFADSRSKINSLVNGEKYVFRLKYTKADENEAGRPESITYQEDAPIFKAGVYQLNDGVYTIEEELFETLSTFYDSNEHWITYALSCKKSLEYNELIKLKLGFFLQFESCDDAYYIEDVEFFPYVTYEDEDGVSRVVIPGGDLISYVKTLYYVYEPNKEYKSIEDVVYIYKGDRPSNYTQVYNDGDGRFEKTRSITASESNRFNLIQELCELFECWAKFEIEHESDGRIKLDDNFQQLKWVTFHESIGNPNYAGFKYGVNLKSIQRTLESDGIVSKLVVKDNTNEFGANGFCSITRGNENPCGENFIYDFSYYIQQGLLLNTEVNLDLYSNTDGYMGYYTKLREFNIDRDKWIEEQSKISPDISKYEASYQTYKVSVEESEEELRDTYVQIETMTGFTYGEMVKISKNQDIGKEVTQEDKNWWNKNEFLSLVSKLGQLIARIKQHKKMRDQAETYWTGAQNKFDNLKEQLKELANKKRALNLQFYKKYSRFIQEGSWINEDYIDDNLYYLDAKSTLYTSAQPKVTYTINVLELSQLEGYENYSFMLGDKTYMEDTEFFGWVWKHGIQTPYHEEVVVSEITWELDSPEKNIVKVQNYKTQFEDLFQRITATTQSVEYHTGEYAKASSIVESDGTISIQTLQNSISNNALTISNARDQSVVIDENGITTTSLARPNEMIRLVSGGLFLSKDGGTTWSTGITGSGINANYITTGQINTDKIFIMSGNFPSFKWDGNGISAYEFKTDSNGKPYGFNTSKFVRFDQYGLYGIKGIEDFVAKNEQDVWNNANFALTWRGFQIKSAHGENGAVIISSDNDIQVLNTEGKEQIKIGLLGSQNIEGNAQDVYGIRIKDINENIVMENDSTGALWLKKELNVQTYNSNNKVAIGTLDSSSQVNKEHGGRIIDANSKFTVYEDGYMKANGGEFTGTINATGGKIGNMTIGEVEESAQLSQLNKKLDIQSDLGYNFKVGENLEGAAIISPAVLKLKAVSQGFTFNSNKQIKWEISEDFVSWILLSENNTEYELSYEKFKDNSLNDISYIKVSAYSQEGEEYSNWVTIMAINDGQKGDKGDKGDGGNDAIRCIIESSSGDKFTNGNIQTVLTCRIFDSKGEVDPVNNTEGHKYKYSYTWLKITGTDNSTTSEAFGSGKQINITGDHVNEKAVFSCKVVAREEVS